MTTVITFGTFDLFHFGHLMILQRAKEYGDQLIVGVSTDALTVTKKNRKPVVGETVRKAIVEAIRYVDKVFDEESLEEKEQYIKYYQADVLVMGDDWKGKFDHLPCQVIYLPRTANVSTTEIIKKCSLKT